MVNQINFCCLFSLGNLAGDGPVYLVLSCVDNFEARMTINAVSARVSTHSFQFFYPPAVVWCESCDTHCIDFYIDNIN